MKQMVRFFSLALLLAQAHQAYTSGRQLLCLHL